MPTSQKVVPTEETEGQGGSVFLVGDSSLNTLVDLRFQPQLKAKNGQSGSSSVKKGANGQSLDVKVPCGTTVIDDETLVVIGDVTDPNQRLRVAEGGNPGRGKRFVQVEHQPVAQANNQRWRRGASPASFTATRLGRCWALRFTKCRQVDFVECCFGFSTKNRRLSVYDTAPFIGCGKGEFRRQFCDGRCTGPHSRCFTRSRVGNKVLASLDSYINSSAPS